MPLITLLMLFALSFFGSFLSLAATAIFSLANGLGSALPVSVALSLGWANRH